MPDRNTAVTFSLIAMMCAIGLPVERDTLNGIIFGIALFAILYPEDK